MGQLFNRKSIWGVGLAIAIFIPLGAHATEFTVLYDFAGGSDGASPYGTLIEDSSGNLYGTTGGGGFHEGYGTVFEIAPDGTESVLLAFHGHYYGQNPQAGLTADKQGNLYGTTVYGGYGRGKNCGVRKVGCGNVFKLAADGQETELYSFAGGTDGAFPNGLIEDKQGNLYGTTAEGGEVGCGTVFKLAPNGTKTILHNFLSTEGCYPQGSLIADKQGDFYGTTESYGSNGLGTVFKLAQDGTLTVLYAFKSGNDGAYPLAGLIVDGQGDFYGTTSRGGGTGCYEGCGTVFKLAPDGTETVLYSFTGGNDGYYPHAGLIVDKQGNLYGTTLFGGDATCECGTAFELAPDDTKTMLHTFTGGATDGAFPYAGLKADAHGNLFGVAAGGGAGCGGYGCGVVFKLKKRSD